MTDKPDLVILGQITIDHVVPPQPGPWSVQVGGNALFAAAGARLWMDPAGIGLVFRRGTGFPLDVEAVLAKAGIVHVERKTVEIPHLTEWIIYEPDGSRRCLPRNEGLLQIGSEGEASDIGVYFDYLLRFSPEASDLPSHWLPAKAIHLAPQVRDRQASNLIQLTGQAGLLYVDPSAFVSKRYDAAGLAGVFHGATGLLPSELEVSHLVTSNWNDVALDLHRSGFEEVILKRGSDAVILAFKEGVETINVPVRTAVDPTGAGDSFCGAYAACRMLGHSPHEAVRRAIVTAGMVIETQGAEAALQLRNELAAERLAQTT